MTKDNDRADADCERSDSVTKEQLAAELDGMEYPGDLTQEQQSIANASGLMVLFGASDDLVEIYGVVRDEMGAGDDTMILLDDKGFVSQFRDDAWTDADMEDWFSRRRKAKKVTARWGQNGYSWTYETDLSHATFGIMEDGDPYCKGLVIDAADLR